MRLQKYLTVIFLGTMVTLSANAVTKSFTLNSSSKCTGNPQTKTKDWSASCDNISVKGVGVCSSTSGVTNQTEDHLETDSTTGVNKHCWCKMTHPGVSKFVFAGDFGYASSCFDRCAYNCVLYIVNPASYRAALFGDVQ